MKSVKFDRLLASSALGLGFCSPATRFSADESDPQAADGDPLPTPVRCRLRTRMCRPSRVRGRGEGRGQDATRDAQGCRCDSKPDAMSPAGACQAAAAPATVAPVEANADSALADKLRDIVTGKQLDRVVVAQGRPRRRRAILQGTRLQAAVGSNGAADDRAKAAVAYLAQVDTVGLDPNDYPVPNFKAAATPDALAEAEIKFTNSVLNYARQAEIGRIHFSRVGADIQFNLVAPEPEKVLAKLAEASDVGAALDSYNPPQQEFKALKEKLAELRKGPVATPLKKRSRSRSCTSATARSCARA